MAWNYWNSNILDGFRLSGLHSFLKTVQGVSQQEVVGF